MRMKQWIAIGMSCLLLAGCAAGAGKNADAEAPKETATVENSADKKAEGLRVVTSTFILEDLAREIAGERAEVHCLIPEGEGTHGFEPTPKDINTLNEADVFLYNGAGLESWTDTLIDQLPDTVAVAEASEGIELLAGGHHHDHDGEDAREHDADAHGHDAAEHEHDHGGKDPHVWMAPENALVMAKNITRTLKQKDPDGAETYEGNYKRLEEKLQRMDEALQKGLKDISQREMVVSHEAYGYLAAAYDLKQIPIEGINSEGEPDPKTMKEIVDHMREKGIKTVFTEPEKNDNIAKAVAKEAGDDVKVVELDPMEYKSDSSYIDRMQKNLDALENGLR
ncbi:Probable zinc transport system zinc-binding lipoprotein AdcA precursor [Aedoeadaptatus ivorii]|uniref:Probable zinc transport system zinc-binding lipoprotein AdcA n=2 Tax=Aedoeadaptatus ivorii TaxID=54006 RepID=A0A3S4Y625_9FIRM|nr:Probable zinc transport system zinc-binding lipoprotein AdcA precursor [Peptoniphilus ivorii]